MKPAQSVTALSDTPASMPGGLFADFEITGQKRFRAFVASYGIQAILVALLLSITITTTAPVLVHKRYFAISLVAPSPSDPAPIRPSIARMSASPRAAAQSPALPEVSAPKRIPAPRIPRLERTVDVPTPPAPKAVLQPDLLAMVPATPVVKPIHAGSFGDPNGVPVQASAAKRNPASAAIGSFETPTSGTGRPSGRGVAAGVFGTQGGASGQTNKSVKSVDFGEPALTKAQTVIAKVSPLSPVAIQSKPAPVYTEEARRLRVEGDVVLQIVFAATGEIRIAGVVKGLGHGLDEAAIAATRQIRFTPARRDGQLVDYSATVHVVFALS